MHTTGWTCARWSSWKNCIFIVNRTKLEVLLFWHPALCFFNRWKRGAWCKTTQKTLSWGVLSGKAETLCHPGARAANGKVTSFSSRGVFFPTTGDSSFLMGKEAFLIPLPLNSTQMYFHISVSAFCQSSTTGRGSAYPSTPCTQVWDATLRGRAAPRTPDPQEQILLPWVLVPTCNVIHPFRCWCNTWRFQSPEYSPRSGNKEGPSLQPDSQRSLSWAFGDQFPAASNEECKIAVWFQFSLIYMHVFSSRGLNTLATEL